MKNLCAFLIVIEILTVLSIFATAKDLLSEPPVLKVYEVDGNNNVIRLYDQVDYERSEAIIGDLDHLRIECSAYYPVQLIYTGNGIPTLNISLSTADGRTEHNEYIASAFISPLKEYDTGKYRCSRTSHNTASPYIYIYVPGQALFTNPEAKTIQVTERVTSILIPCSVSHPKVQVSLQKLYEKELMAVSSDAILYDPKKGFRVILNKIEYPEGIYICTARHNNIVRGVEYDVKLSRSELVEKFEEFKESTEETCRGESCKQCETHTDCPSMMHCYTDFRCRDPCTYSIRCGEGALCQNTESGPECYCPNGFLGDPTKECYYVSRG